MLARALLPRLDVDVDDVLVAGTADRTDGQVDLIEAVVVGKRLLDREAVRCELLQRELTGLVAWPRALLIVDVLERDACRSGNPGNSASRCPGSPECRPCGLSACEPGSIACVPAPGGAVDGDVDALAAGDFADARRGSSVCTSIDVHRRRAPSRPRSRRLSLLVPVMMMQIGAGLFAVHDLRTVPADPGPGSAPSSRSRSRLRTASTATPLASGVAMPASSAAHVVGHLVQHRVPRQVEILGEAAPQVRREYRRRCSRNGWRPDCDANRSLSQWRYSPWWHHSHCHARQVVLERTRGRLP